MDDLENGSGPHWATDREFWKAVLRAGGSTTIPRWAVDPGAGVGVHETTIPVDLAAALRALAAELAIPLGSIVLAAHAKVLASLSGAREVVTSYVARPGGPLLPCRLTTDPPSWRGLLWTTDRTQSSLAAHQDFPLDDLRNQLGLDGPTSEVMFDPFGSVGDLAESAVLRVRSCHEGGVMGLQLTYRTDVLDADCAARIAGYHVTALALMADDPDAEHERQTLVSAGERHLQLDGFAGRRRILPDLRVHELFEQRVRTHPDALAAVHGEETWTYRELNCRANQLSRALLTRGLRREGVVAVVTERNLDWMASVLAVLKAGGAYLPIEPHFPADRIATTLSRAECRLVLTERGSTVTLDQAVDVLPGVHTLLVDRAYGEGHGTEDPHVPVSPNQLAYIYFTSGSTGQPKGAMCEHTGMLNHLYAKIDDLRLGEGQVVAQTAPQCFDISLWQLISALLVGGRTLLVDEEIILDVQRFVDVVDQGQVSVLQIVPSYLEAVVSYLEQHPRELTFLRCVSVTGEALKTELAQRWFRVQPAITLVNAYGLTETSDDTNHHVMTEAPSGDTVLLGKPVNNVQMYVVDEHLSLVPLGAPGLIVFSGTCVGRGYVNDPERTREAYLTDPHRQGARLYLGGDYGRWRPGGQLEFLGRRDAQVKVAGFRIEIGEIENTLLKVPGVRDGAVVVVERLSRSKQLVAFYSGPRALETSTLRGRLGESLPAYMLPAAFNWLEQLPLTLNGKIDRRALTALANELDVPEPQDQERLTPNEQRLATAWSTVLGIPQHQIRRGDHFFDKGGTSLSAVKLASTMNRAVTLKDVTRVPVLSDQARLLDDRPGPRSGLLRALSEPDGTRAHTMVCFPHAGGQAVSFRPMAIALRDSGLAIYAVERPSHDVTAPGGALASITQVAEQVVAEIKLLGLTSILLWGHSTGAAFAVETARRLQEQGVRVEHLFLAAALLEDADAQRATITELTARPDAEIVATLSTTGDASALGQLDAPGVTAVAAAFRHDFASAHRFLGEAMDSPPSVKLSAPTTVIVAADDPSAAEFPSRHKDWLLLAEQVDLLQLPDGGHDFLLTRPYAAAEAVLAASNL